MQLVQPPVRSSNQTCGSKVVPGRAWLHACRVHGPNAIESDARAVRGDRDAAIRWLARAIDAGRRDLAWDRWDPVFSSLQRDPDFNRMTDATRFAADRDRAAIVVQRLAVTMRPFDRRFGKFLALTDAGGGGLQPSAR